MVLVIMDSAMRPIPRSIEGVSCWKLCCETCTCELHDRSLEVLCVGTVSGRLVLVLVVEVVLVDVVLVEVVLVEVVLVVLVVVVIIGRTSGSSRRASSTRPACFTGVHHSPCPPASS